MTTESRDKGDTQSIANAAPSLPTRKRRVGNQHFAPALAALEHEGFDCILERIRNGEARVEIAAAIGVSVSVLHTYLWEDGRAEATQGAMRASAESWLDRGKLALEQATGKDAAAVQLARAMEQHCARRAALADPLRYSDRHNLEVTGPNGGPIQSQQAVVVFLPHNERDPPLE